MAANRQGNISIEQKKILHFNIQNHIHRKATIILFQICSCQLVLIKLSATHRNQNSPQNCLNRTSLIITLQNSRMQIWVLHLLEFHALQLPSHLKTNCKPPLISLPHRHILCLGTSQLFGLAKYPQFQAMSSDILRAWDLGFLDLETRPMQQEVDQTS